MPQQTFFHETPHANYGLILNDSPDLAHISRQLKAAAKQLDQSNSDIYRVIFNSRSEDSVQIFLAPHLRYRDLAQRMLEHYQHRSTVSYYDKACKSRNIRSPWFKEELQRITQQYGYADKALQPTINLLKRYFAPTIQKLEQALQQLAREHGLGTVKFQEHYAGLADTWLEFPEIIAAS